MTTTYTLRASAILNVFWIPIAFQEASLLAIAVPAKLLQLAPATYTSALAALASLAALVSMISPPIAGMISDHLRRRGGGRKTIIIGGAALDVVCLLLAAQATSTAMLALYFLLAIVGANASITAYQALLPDTVPRSSWGAVSGMRGAANLLGTVIGLAVAGLTNPTITFTATAIVVAVGAFSVYGIKQHSYTDEEEHAQVRNWRDFIITFVARLFIGFGLSMLMTFALYFFHDILKVENASAGTGLVAICALLGAIVSSIFLGRLSDRVRRKWVVSLSGIPMALGAFGFALVPDARAVYGFALLFGLGYGGVFSTAWALAIDSIPKLRDVARDLGIWGLASNIPAVIAPVAGGWILAGFGSTTFAYQILFFVAGLSFAIGSVVVLAVHGPKELALNSTTTAVGR